MTFSDSRLDVIHEYELVAQFDFTTKTPLLTNLHTQLERQNPN